MKKNKMLVQLGSLVFPGFGYIYVGKVSEGIMWTRGSTTANLLSEKRNVPNSP